MSVAIVRQAYVIETPAGHHSWSQVAEARTSVRPAGSIARPLARVRAGFATSGCGQARGDGRQHGAVADPEHLAAHHDEHAEAHDRSDDAELRTTGAEPDPEPLDEPRPAAAERLEDERPARGEVLRCDVRRNATGGGQPGRRSALGRASMLAAWLSTRAVSENRTRAWPGSTTRTAKPVSGAVGTMSPTASVAHSGTSVTALVPPMSSWS